MSTSITIEDIYKLFRASQNDREAFQKEFQAFQESVEKDFSRAIGSR